MESFVLPFCEFSDIFAQYELPLSEKQYQNFGLYAKLLMEWNEKINLTAICDPEGITVKHMLDSVLALKYGGISNDSSCIDVGTGAGFPGIPIKIYNDTLNCTLLDSLNKRVKFLVEVSETLGLEMKCVHLRAEDGGKSTDMRENYDVSIARAVAALPVLCEYCMPFVRVGGKFVAMKGPNEDVKDAYAAIKILGGEVSDVVQYELPGSDKRQIIIIEKTKSTPAKYPRNSGQIAKKAL